MLFPPSIPLFLSFPIVLNFQIGHLQQYFLISVIDLNLYMSWSDSLCIEATLQHIFARFDGNSVDFCEPFDWKSPFSCAEHRTRQYRKTGTNMLKMCQKLTGEYSVRVKFISRCAVSVQPKIVSTSLFSPSFLLLCCNHSTCLYRVWHFCLVKLSTLYVPKLFLVSS